MKLYVDELGTPWLRRLVAARDPVADIPFHQFIISRVTVVETAAAFYRRAHRSTQNFEEAGLAVASLQRDVQDIFRVIEVSPGLANLALEVAARRGLRGYDCLQLAGALSSQRMLIASGVGPFYLLSADVELNRAAQLEGITSVNPNDRANFLGSF